MYLSTQAMQVLSGLGPCPVERGGLPGLVTVIFDTLVTWKRGIEWSPGGFKITMKVESLWLQKRSTGPALPKMIMIVHAQV